MGEYGGTVGRWSECGECEVRVVNLDGIVECQASQAAERRGSSRAVLARAAELMSGDDNTPGVEIISEVREPVGPAQCEVAVVVRDRSANSCAGWLPGDEWNADVVVASGGMVRPALEAEAVVEWSESGLAVLGQWLGGCRGWREE